MTILVVYEDEPNFPATDQQPDAVRYQIGKLWVDAIGSAPTQADLDAFFSPPASISPMDYPLQPYQFFSMLDIAGLTPKVSAAIAAMPDPTQRIIASNKLAHTAVFTRDDPLFETLKSAVGVTDVQIDAMWMQAKDL